MVSIENDVKQAREASFLMSSLTEEEKNRSLMEIKKQLFEKREQIFAANQKDLLKSEQNHLSTPLMKRLKFDENKLAEIIDGISSLEKLPDPIGQSLFSRELDQDLELYRVSCPLGVIGVIFESRPDALVQIAVLCLKTGNSVILKGGSEAFHTNRILAEIIEKAGEISGLPAGWIHLWETRDQVEKMLDFNEYIDLLIPRGSNAFVRHIMDHTSIPVLGHADGVCHLYIHEEAETEMALRLALDSKTQYAAVCNAAETILIDNSIAKNILPGLAKILKEKDVQIYGCEKTAEILEDILPVEAWHHEYLDYKISIRIVSGFEEAIKHINTYGSGHTDCIVTENNDAARIFMRMVDSGNVYWNCSTRFSDGFRYGFGAEVGVSTSKIHARGPVGLEGLVTYKYLLFGKGQIVSDYVEGKTTFTHIPISLDKRKW